MKAMKRCPDCDQHLDPYRGQRPAGALERDDGTLVQADGTVLDPELPDGSAGLAAIAQSLGVPLEQLSVEPALWCARCEQIVLESRATTDNAPWWACARCALAFAMPPGAVGKKRRASRDGAASHVVRVRRAADDPRGPGNDYHPLCIDKLVADPDALRLAMHEHALTCAGGHESIVRMSHEKPASCPQCRRRAFARHVCTPPRPLGDWAQA